MWMSEVSKDNKNIHIRGSFKHMEVLRAKVFDPQSPTIEHIECKNKPVGLDEDMYILIYRKQKACLRHEIFKFWCEQGSTKPTDPIKQAESKAKFNELLDKSDYFLEKSFELYGIHRHHKDRRPISVLWRECFLDFYSKSLEYAMKQEKPWEPLVFLTRVQTE